VEVVYGDSYIDSVAIMANESITGCGPSNRKVIGSKTHRAKFPINAHIQLFSQGDLWKEFFIKMDKNTTVTIFTKIDCSYPSAPYLYTFSNLLESAKKQNRFIDLSFTDDYCWLLEKMVNSHDDMHCTEYSVDGKEEVCDKWF
jgi:hypothetical protein